MRIRCLLAAAIAAAIAPADAAADATPTTTANAAPGTAACGPLQAGNNN